jgi:hypothetical protein
VSGDVTGRAGGRGFGWHTDRDTSDETQTGHSCGQRRPEGTPPRLIFRHSNKEHSLISLTRDVSVSPTPPAVPVRGATCPMVSHERNAAPLCLLAVKDTVWPMCGLSSVDRRISLSALRPLELCLSRSHTAERASPSRRLRRRQRSESVVRLSRDGNLSRGRACLCRSGGTHSFE